MDAVLAFYENKNKIFFIDKAYNSVFLLLTNVESKSQWVIWSCIQWDRLPPFTDSQNWFQYTYPTSLFLCSVLTFITFWYQCQVSEYAVFSTRCFYYYRSPKHLHLKQMLFSLLFFFSFIRNKIYLQLYKVVVSCVSWLFLHLMNFFSWWDSVHLQAAFCTVFFSVCKLLRLPSLCQCVQSPISVEQNGIHLSTLIIATIETSRWAQQCCTLLLFVLVIGYSTCCPFSHHIQTPIGCCDCDWPLHMANVDCGLY
jgi:hypothetical protein